MKTRILATILVLSLLLSLAACAEKKPKNYPKNDFANLLSTDFWSMTESDLDAFLTSRRWKSLPDSAGRYLGSLMKQPAVLCASYNAEGRVTALSVEQQFYNEAAKGSAQYSDHAQLREDTATEFARFVSAARQVFAANHSIIGIVEGAKLQGKTEEDLQAYFRTTMDMHLATAIYYSTFNTTPSYLEGPYRFSNGSNVELAMQVTFHQDDKDVPMQHLASQALRLYAPDYAIPAPTESESDVWAAYRDAAVEDTSLPEWISEADNIEMLHHCCESSHRRVLPEEHVDALLHALPQWVGNPTDADSVDIYDGSDSYQLYFYNGTQFLGLVTFKLHEGWLAVYTKSDPYEKSEQADAYYRFNTTTKKPDLDAIFDLCTRRHLIPNPATMQIVSPEGQTAEIPAPEAAALAMQINDALWLADDVYMPNEAERLLDGGYWILRVTSENGEEIEMWLDCYDPVSPLYPWGRFEDDLGNVAFCSTREQMTALKALLQSYLE